MRRLRRHGVVPAGGRPRGGAAGLRGAPGCSRWPSRSAGSSRSSSTPAQMTHVSVAGSALQVPDDLVRLSVGHRGRRRPGGGPRGRRAHSGRIAPQAPLSADTRSASSAQRRHSAPRADSGQPIGRGRHASPAPAPGRRGGRERRVPRPSPTCSTAAPTSRTWWRSPWSRPSWWWRTRASPARCAAAFPTVAVALVAQPALHLWAESVDPAHTRGHGFAHMMANGGSITTMQVLTSALAVLIAGTCARIADVLGRVIRRPVGSSCAARARSRRHRSRAAAADRAAELLLGRAHRPSRAACRTGIRYPCRHAHP